MSELTIEQLKADRHAVDSGAIKVKHDYADRSDITHGHHDTTRQRLQAALDFLGRRWCLHPQPLSGDRKPQQIPKFLRATDTPSLLRRQAS